MERRINAGILEELELDDVILPKTVKTRKLRFFGHGVRHESLHRDVLQGAIEEGNDRATKDDLAHNVRDRMTTAAHGATRRAHNRDEWRRVAEALNERSSSRNVTKDIT